jgi:hypothetical protein
MKRIIGFLFVVIFIVSCNKYEKEYYENGNLKSKCQVDKNGIKHGLSIFYYEDGGIKYTFNYNHGKQNDTNKMFYEDGNILFKKYYENGFESGASKYFNKDGTINKIIYYNKGTQLNIQEYMNDKVTKQLKRVFFESNYDTIALGDTFMVKFGFIPFDTNSNCEDIKFLYNSPKLIKNGKAALDNYFITIETNNCQAQFRFHPTNTGSYGYRLAFQERIDTNKYWFYTYMLDFYVNNQKAIEKSNYKEGLIEGILVEERE